MDYSKKNNYTFFNYNISEKKLPESYTGALTISIRDGIDIEKSPLINPEMISAAVYENGEKKFNPLFGYDRDSVHFGEGNYAEYVNALGLELLYDVRFGYDGYAFEIVYHNPRELQLWVDEGDGWKIVFDKYHIGHNEDKAVALRIAFEEGASGVGNKNYKMRRFILRTTGWFGGIIREKDSSVVKSIIKKRPLAVFEGTSITESCNAVSGFNGYSYARILSDIYGFDYLCLAQGGTGMARPTASRPCMLDRINGVISVKPDILFMEVGINDQPDEKLKVATEAYLKRVRADLPETFAVMIGAYCPKYDPNSTPTSIEKDKITSSVCKKYGVPFISLVSGKVYGADGELVIDMGAPLIVGTGTAFAPDGSGTADRYIGRPTVKDGCHCNPLAYKMMAEYIRSAFNSIIDSLI